MNSRPSFETRANALLRMRPETMSKTPVMRVEPGDRLLREPVYFSLIGGAIFSAGAGGNADAAPVVCAGVSG